MSAARSAEHEREAARANGPAAAALVSSGVGVFALGLLTTLTAASKAIAKLLTWSGPVGPLSGKALGAVIVWLVAWAITARRWRDTDVDFDRVWRWTLVLIAIGFLFTFPPFYEAFGD